MAFRNKTAVHDAQGSVAMPLAASFVAFARSRGIDDAELLRVARLSRPQLDDPEARLPLRSFAELVWQAKRSTDEPGLPLFFAAESDFSDVSIAGLIANASPTMADALDHLNRYSGLAISAPMEGEVPLRFELGAQNDRIVNCRHPAFAFPELTEIVFTYLITGPRRFLPSPHVVAARLDYQEPAHSRVYSDIWQCDVSFDAVCSELILPKWVAGHPVRLQPPYALSILSGHADLMLADLEEHGALSRRLQALMMRELHTGEVTAEWAAAEFGMSRQTLYRRLKDEGTSFEETLDEIRLSVAIDHLEHGTATIVQIAHLTGYSDASAFSRAFKRSIGKMPGAWRRSKGDVQSGRA
uniref:helix-turn-helix domain-containing protein n=1 Tax=uncultured Altererythrobacter sp. TaxID=500840 RepID=UPI00263624B5|nr:AraC family transcriptional regulator [uncultured Altererythrobacter sp.]